jgi:K+-sensing histidine kinase KdpD
VELLGGTVTAANRDQGGAVFTVKLPTRTHESATTG